ncbi:uncharacterized protein PAC_11511 [Phialocephala subalpina]|uniref:NCT transcriptional regulatory complex subunit A n=1 Tax=Phialocephala subalpina TaxID=576137 RepID=A0A1L7X9B5_9HELO|nr:uncharacterized protein PAC_11511 [Phialocephala subalpina]
MDSTYAPQSPDLSSFLSSPAKAQQPFQQTSTSYAPRSPVIPSFNTASQPQPQYHTQNIHAYNTSQSSYNSDFTEYANSQYMPPIPSLPPSHTFDNNLSLYQQQTHRNPFIKSESSYTESDADGDYIPSPTMSSRGPRIKSDPSSSSYQPAQPPAYKNPNPNNIEIKTKFPVARIKRIMQADEEVGKVAQVTPVAVSKALELFMIALIGGAADKAREKGGKKVTAQHLKQVVLGSPEQFDFLAEIVGRVSEAQEGAGGEKKRKEKVEASSDSEEEKKPKKGRGRKKKSDD